MTMKNLHIYFIHCSALTERNARIDSFRSFIAKNTFKTFKVESIRVISEHDPNAIPVDVIQKAVDYTQIPGESKASYLNGFLKNIHIYQLSNSLKHMRALEYASQCESLEDLHLILEDDVLFDEKNFAQQLETLVSKINDETDIVFLGLPSPMEIPENTSITLTRTEDNFKVLPLVDSYILRKPVAEKLKNSFIPVKFITNVQMQYAMIVNSIKSYQCVPNIFVDGTKFGTYISSLSTNNILVFNKEYMMLNELVNKDLLSSEEQALAQKIIDSSPIKKHPDFMYMTARFFTKIGKYKDAELLYAEAYNMLIMRSAIVNHESGILKDFIRLFNHLQQ